MRRTLIVDDDDTLRLTLRLALEREGFTVEEAKDGEEAVELVRSKPSFDAVFLDVNMPRLCGIQALQKIKEIDPQVFCLILTAYSDVKDAVTAIKLGAYDYVEKPVEIGRILRMLEQARAANHMVEVAAFSAPQVNFAEGRTMIGGSSEIKRVFGVIHKLSKVDTSVIIRGESGTGKELVARAIHFNSSRKKGPFVAVNCAAIPDNLIESELFGHEKGAFTGADKKKLGKFQYAEGGTLFLDEIGDISAAMQVKFLRVLQEKVFTPVGANNEHHCDVRIIAATNCPLEKMIEEGKFRADLFYRLHVLPITLPPLRERADDIPVLAEFMIKKFNGCHHRSIQSIHPQAMAALMAYHWPGNIRELENVIEHAFILESTDVVTLDALPAYVTDALVEDNSGPGKNPEEIESVDLESVMSADVGGELNFPMLKEKFERDFLIKALKAYDGRVNRTAAHTKMTKVTLLRKLEKYGINPREFYKT